VRPRTAAKVHAAARDREVVHLEPVEPVGQHGSSKLTVLCARVDRQAEQRAHEVQHRAEDQLCGAQRDRIGHGPGVLVALEAAEELGHRGVAIALDRVEDAREHGEEALEVAVAPQALGDQRVVVRQIVPLWYPSGL
jgi:hypothetical protein